jgi:hypothetical protein
MAELYEVVLIDGPRRWHAGLLADEITETDVLLADKGQLHDDPPDEVDLDLGGWLSRGSPEPATAEVSELWHLLYDDPVAGHALGGEEIGEAYDDLVEELDDWFDRHGERARSALTAAVAALRTSFRPL